jgi:uncharacterized protein
MGLLITLIISEMLLLVLLKQHFYNQSKPKYYLSLIIHILLSLWVWVTFFETILFRGPYDSPRHVWLMMILAGVVIAIVVPRFIVIIMHFTGKLINRRTGNHIRGLTNAAFIIMGVIMLIISISTTYGRFNFRTEPVTIKIPGLKNDLDGLKIVQVSDLHLITFYHHKRQLRKVMDEISTMRPDILINTGDFISFGWREFEKDDTILSKAKSKYGNFAILGNHDVGTYDPDYTDADRTENVAKVNDLIKLSGYQVLNDESVKVKIGDATLAIIGVTTGGRHPHMTHGNLTEAIAGLDSVDLKILLSHDPNHWTEAVARKTDIDITFSGHTHGMQMGIYTKNFRWSPSKYFYPHWNGLYSSGKQYHYVNRGLGVLSIPFRIWMPPEITVITLRKE